MRRGSVGRADYARWSLEELRDLAAKLGVENVEQLSHGELVQKLAELDAADQRARGAP